MKSLIKKFIMKLFVKLLITDDEPHVHMREQMNGSWLINFHLDKKADFSFAFGTDKLVPISEFWAPNFMPKELDYYDPFPIRIETHMKHD